MSLVPSIWKAAMAPCQYKHCLLVLVSSECLFSSFHQPIIRNHICFLISCVFKSSGFLPLEEDWILAFLFRMSLFCSTYFGCIFAGEIIYCLENAANLHSVDLNDLSVTLDIFVLTLPLEIDVMADFHHNRWAKIQNHLISTTVCHNGVYCSHGFGCKEQQANRGRSRTNRCKISVNWSLQCQNISFLPTSQSRKCLILYYLKKDYHRLYPRAVTPCIDPSLAAWTLSHTISQNVARPSGHRWCVTLLMKFKTPQKILIKKICQMPTYVFFTQDWEKFCFTVLVWHFIQQGVVHSKKAWVAWCVMQQHKPLLCRIGHITGSNFIKTKKIAMASEARAST